MELSRGGRGAKRRGRGRLEHLARRHRISGWQEYLLDAGHTWAAIRQKLDCTDSFIDRWSKRFVAERLAGLFSRHAGQLPTTLTPALEARILEWSVKRKPTDGSTHWSTRKLADRLGSHTRWCRACGASMRGDRIGSSAIWPRTIRTSRPKPPTLSASICIRRSTRRCFASMRRRPFKRWIVRIPCCRSLRAAPSATASNISGTARCRCTPRSTPRPVKSWERQPPATPPPTSSLSSGDRRQSAARQTDPHHPR